MPLQCLGRRHTITMSWKTTCHCNVSEKDMPENILRKTTCQCNVSENATPLQCLSEDDMPLQCLPDKSDGCLPLPHHVLSSAVAISAKLKNHFSTYESWFQNSCSNAFISIAVSFTICIERFRFLSCILKHYLIRTWDRFTFSHYSTFQRTYSD